MMKRYIILLFLLSAPLLMSGQTNSVIEKMRKERAEMEEQIARQEKILTSTESSITSQVSNLKQPVWRKRYSNLKRNTSSARSAMPRRAVSISTRTPVSIP